MDEVARVWTWALVLPLSVWTDELRLPVHIHFLFPPLPKWRDINFIYGPLSFMCNVCTPDDQTDGWRDLTKTTPQYEQQQKPQTCMKLPFSNCVGPLLTGQSLGQRCHYYRLKCHPLRCFQFHSGRASLALDKWLTHTLRWQCWRGRFTFLNDDGKDGGPSKLVNWGCKLNIHIHFLLLTRNRISKPRFALSFPPSLTWVSLHKGVWGGLTTF